MRHFKITSAAASIIAAAAALSSLTASAVEYFSPVYKDFNGNDVNGEIVLEIPEGLPVEVSVYFTSPENTGGKDIYYHEIVYSGGSLGFELEGRDTVKDDFRDYELEIFFEGLDNIPFTDKLNVPDGNDHPDSYRKFIYNFTVDSVYTGSPWTVDTKRGEYIKDVALHMNAVLLGDVDGNGAVNSADATLVLGEYSEISTGGKGTLTAAQTKAADVNGDNSVNSVDASYILQFYSVNSTGGTADWKEIIGK